ncbi:MAG: serine/threonine protein kinase, partial [Phycisphaerae bacterium]
MTAKWERVREIFEEGLDRPGSELESYLDQACGNDDELRASVKALFDADNDTTPFLEPKSRGAALALMGEVFARGEGMDPHQEPILIGPYQLEDTIASGGMGTVYRAIRTDGSYDHRVAIKVIKPGMATEDVLRRFKQERQTLARLNHPHIAQILDGGATNEGGPYLVMEYVNGVPIHTFCRENQQSLEDRLRIFSDVCEAVHYAHRNFVVHRDIKPGNILVNHDGQAKLLDFGIAKLMDDDDGSFTTTNASQRLMTPQYASPEQLTGGDITTASDVYSLGVVLYELLTGTRPYDLRGKKGDEARRVVCETTPSAPSTAVIRTETGRDNDPASGNPLTLGGGSLTPLSPSRLSRRLRGDLDTIVLTALHKDPDRRYASVDRLAEDIQRYRQGLPIHARRDSWTYRTNKFVRRHKVAVAAGVVMLMSLTAGAIGATWGMVRAQAGEQKARQGEMVARLEEEKARETVQFLQDMLAAAEPLNEPKDITVREILDQAALLLASDEDTKPEVRAAIH